jgi:DNA-binding protein HU-beta
MNKSELIEAVANNAGVSKAVAGKVFDSFVGTVVNALGKGDEIVVTGFGSFGTKKRSARKGRNPKTGEEMHIPAGTSVKFKPGKSLKDAVK